MSRKDKLIYPVEIGRYPQIDPFYLLRSMFFRKSKGLEILVLGAGRGGTSLLASLLDAHPQLEVATEEYVGDFLVPPSGPSLIEPELKLAEFIAANDKLAKKSKLRFGNKITTEQLGFVEDYGRNQDGRMALLEKLFKGRKILFILRDGRYCISSKLERTQVDYVQALAYWRHSVELYQFLQSQAVDLHSLRFEDLVANPRETLARACDFLGLNYSDSMLSGTASDRIYIDYRRPGLDADRANRELDPRVKLEDIQDYLHLLGYLSDS